MPKSFPRDYWDTIIKKNSGSIHEDLWRAYLKEVYQELMNRWIGNSRHGIALKTDLYDEAVSNNGIIPLWAQNCERIIGTDISLAVVSAAKKNVMKDMTYWHYAVCSDIRNLSFKSNSFDQVLSYSTLDHFPQKKDILECLKELRRIMKPEGTLIITLDNPSNPIVFLRNKLPYHFLKFLGLVPYYMGETLSKSELIRILKSTGFKVCDSAVIVHAPRIFAIWTGHMLHRLGNEKIKGYYLKFLKIFERLGKFPTGFLTGYFVAAKAVKREPQSSDRVIASTSEAISVF